MRRITSISVVFSTLLLISISLAQQPASTAVPNLIRYGGVLKDAQGAALSSATTGVTFAIYKQQDGGAAVWMETQNVASDASGQYSVVLGSTTATGLPSDLFSLQEQRWLGVQVQGEAEQPRVLLVSVPYAFKAHEAETLGGKRVSDFVLANGASSGANVSNASPTSSPTSSTNPASSETKKGIAIDGPTDFFGSTTDQIVAVTQSGTGAGVNVSSISKAVMGSISGPGVAIFGQASSTSAQAYGVQGNSASTIGIGLLGFATATTGYTYGLKGYSSSISGTGVRGLSTAGTGATTGISAQVSSPNGTAGVFDNTAGGTILRGQTNGTGVFYVYGGGSIYTVGSVGASGEVSAGRDVDTYGTYEIQSSTVLQIGNRTDGNVFVGVSAGASDQAGMGHDNTFAGASAGYSNTTGSYNSFVGNAAGYFNTTGIANTFSGDQAGYSNTTGIANSFSGNQAGYSNTSGFANTFNGNQAGNSNTTGGWNTFTGYYAGYNNTAGNNNIYIGNPGPTSGTESSTIRIGGDVGDGPQTAAYLAGIYGVNVGGVPVQINSNGQLGAQTSSLRFKEQIADMADSTNRLFQLRPVTFLYRPEYDKGERTLQYGLIAEEVAKVYPDMVAYDKDGQPYTVKYQYLAPMLLNEVQKQHAVVAAQQDVIATQQKQIESLQKQNVEFQQRLSRLESLIAKK